MDQVEVDLESEETRIRSVYAKRQGAFRYSWFNQAHVFRFQELERDILAVLRATEFQHLQEKRILEIWMWARAVASSVHQMGSVPRKCDRDRCSSRPRDPSKAVKPSRNANSLRQCYEAPVQYRKFRPRCAVYSLFVYPRSYRERNGRS